MAVTAGPAGTGGATTTPIGTTARVIGFGALSAVVVRLAASVTPRRDGTAPPAGWGCGRRIPLFAEHPPAGIALWGRHPAYGAALGVAHGAVAGLPLGAESPTEAWSSVGGRWRVVHIRYPDVIPPGYGRHPFCVTVCGAALMAIGIPLYRRPWRWSAWPSGTPGPAAPTAPVARARPTDPGEEPGWDRSGC